MGASMGVFAHQGGWDELLLVATPIALFVVLLKIANGRAAKLTAPPAHEPEGPGGPDGPGRDG